MAKCYGWLDFNQHVVLDIPRRRAPPAVYLPDISRSLEYEKDYITFVNEYIPQAGNDSDVIDGVYRFMRLFGFCWTDKAERNWRGGVFVDHSDIVFTHV